MAVDAYGAITFWGFSPTTALNNLQKDESPNNALNILVVGAADLRHVLKTIAKRKSHRIGDLNFYITENNLETLARQMLFLSLALEPKESLGLQEKSQLFLEIFGNSLIRPQTNEYIKKKANEFIKYVTDPDFLESKFPILDLSSLKFKERDQLEAIFKFWRSTDRKTFDINAHWEQRCRHYLGVRYDSRLNSYDWDYNMKLKDKAPIINFREYKTWRESGVAFKVRDDSSYEVPNRTLASGILFKKDGETIGRRGYWGDIINSPYLSFGIESDEKSLFKQANGIYTKTSTNVAEYNVTALFHEITTGEEYVAFSTEMAAVSKKMQETNLQDKADESEAKKKSEIEPDQKKSGEKLDKPATDESPGYIIPDGVRIHFLPLNSLSGLSKKRKFSKLFYVLYFSNSMVHQLTDDIKPIIDDNARLILETTKFMLDLKKELSEEYLRKVKGMAEVLGFKAIRDHNPEKDAFASFQYQEGS